MPRELGPFRDKLGDVKSLGRLRNITDTGHFRSGYNACPKCGGPKSYYAGMCAICKGTPGLLVPGKRIRKQKEDGTYRLPLCGAKHLSKAARAAEPDWRCKNGAGKGTNHVGVGPCRVHGGNNPKIAMKALQIKATMEMMEAESAEAGRRSKPKAAEVRTRVGTKKVDVDAIIVRHRAKKGKRKARS